MQILKKNWDYRFRNFEKTILSWSSRVLNIFQKIEVIKMFGLSRTYYSASILPLSKTNGRRFESIIGNFIWKSSGRILRVSLEELKLPISKGGLGLACIHRMGSSLLLSQSLRLLKNGDTKSKVCMGYWVGQILGDVIPEMDLGIVAAHAPLYFQNLAYLFTDAKLADLFTVSKWECLTNKVIYLNQLSSLPPPKVEVDFGSSLTRSWNRLWFPSVTSEKREILFLLMHQKLPVRERLFRIGIVTDPYCDTCLPELGATDSICDIPHFFCQCLRVSDSWRAVKHVICSMLHSWHLADSDLIALRFPRHKFDQEITWLLGSYLQYTWSLLHYKGLGALCRAQLFGYLKFKYNMDQLGARQKLDESLGFLMHQQAGK